MKYNEKFFEKFEHLGEKYVIRSVSENDQEKLIEAFKMASHRTLNSRFLAAKKSLSKKDLELFTCPDYINHVALTVMQESEDGEKPVGSTRFYRDSDNSPTAEFAVTVIDKYHRKGFGGILIDHLIKAAKERDIKEIYGTASTGNHAVLGLLKSRGDVVVETETMGIVNIRLKL
ncbi:GNAT family N-acetyltransferase [Halobacteriovorax sp. XZX-3]|uniref:GNAT family N-acetyltransferase n=1 Tax=unclassified Halobacteriovorax TaxID=2639665 RepID=UPI0011AF912E|nr:GNAT family N-acetyltransferase [Halobacteriovorax sp. DA5]